MISYDTVSEAVNDLYKRGYVYNFNIKEECIECEEINTALKPDEFEIDEIYRFEGDSDPGDEMIVYAISSKQHNLKGVLVNAFVPYSDSASSELISSCVKENLSNEIFCFLIGALYIKNYLKNQIVNSGK